MLFNVTNGYQDFQKIDAVSCQCQDILIVLLTNGLFPTAPTSPRMAVSVFLLDFYAALFERSCDAINALASALNTFYKRRGFVPINRKVCVNVIHLRYLH